MFPVAVNGNITFLLLVFKSLVLTFIPLIPPVTNPIGSPSIDLIFWGHVISKDAWCWGYKCRPNRCFSVLLMHTIEGRHLPVLMMLIIKNGIRRIITQTYGKLQWQQVRQRKGTEDMQWGLGKTLTELKPEGWVGPNVAKRGGVRGGRAASKVEETVWEAQGRKGQGLFHERRLLAKLKH